jgi:hypothetical protein
MMNQVLTVFIKSMGFYEKHHSLDGMEASAFIRIFVLGFINTGERYTYSIRFDDTDPCIGYRHLDSRAE